MIELRKISAGYRGEPVLRDVDLVFPAGCVTVLLGPNGCGKSTLLKTALGLLPALSGEVLYDGAPLSGMPPEPGGAARGVYGPEPQCAQHRGAAHGAARAVPVPVVPAALPQKRLCGRAARDGKGRTRWSWRTVRCRS